MTSSSHGAAAESLGAPPLPGFGGAAPSERPPASVVMDPEVPWSRHCFAAAAEALASVSGRCDAAPPDTAPGSAVRLFPLFPAFRSCPVMPRLTTLCAKNFFHVSNYLFRMT